MKVVLSTPGVFHHFALARELEKRNHLERIYTTYPWRRIQRESVSKSRVRTFPLIHPADILFSRKLFRGNETAMSAMATVVSTTFDSYIALTMPPCDHYIGMSGSTLKAGRKAQRLGATYIVDRGSSHMRFQQNILAGEYKKWGLVWSSDPAAIQREESEYEAADLIFVPSTFSYRSFVEMGVPAAKLRKVTLAADISRFYPVAEPVKGSFAVLYVGQVSFRKGIQYLLEAFAQIKHPNKSLRMIGAIEPRMQEYLKTAKLERVIFEGTKRPEEIREAMSMANVTVLPSVEDGFGMVLAEAMACGSPVISSDNTGGADLFDHGKEGFITGTRNVEQLRAALEAIAGDPALEESMRAAALLKMQTIGGWRDYGDKVEALLFGLGKNAKG
jgi:glycosyltransferase involved in cell wall biosynthesis